MHRDESFSDQAGASEGSHPTRSAPHGAGNGGRRRLRLERFGRFGRLVASVTLVLGTFVGITAGAIIATAGPAGAAQAVTCIDPASGGTSTTFHEGVASFYLVECEEETGISGTSAYPTIAVNSNTLPPDGSPTLATGSGCTTTTSGSGATEEYIEECKFSDTATTSDAGSYAATFTATPGSFTGSTLVPTTSGTLTVAINAANRHLCRPCLGWHLHVLRRRLGRQLHRRV